MKNTQLYKVTFHHHLQIRFSTHPVLSHIAPQASTQTDRQEFHPNRTLHHTNPSTQSTDNKQTLTHTHKSKKRTRKKEKGMKKLKRVRWEGGFVLCEEVEAREQKAAKEKVVMSIAKR